MEWRSWQSDHLWIDFIEFRWFSPSHFFLLIPNVLDKAKVKFFHFIIFENEMQQKMSFLSLLC